MQSFEEKFTEDIIKNNYKKQLIRDVQELFQSVQIQCKKSDSHIFHAAILDFDKDESYHDFRYLVFTLKHYKTDYYEINGFYSPSNDKIYYAYLHHCTTNKTLDIIDNYVLHPEMKRKGIGSIGMSCIKQLADKLSCTQITGTKRPVPNTQEEMDKLTRFYAKNGFAQSSTLNNISFDMSTYRTGEKNK